MLFIRIHRRNWGLKLVAIFIYEIEKSSENLKIIKFWNYLSSLRTELIFIHQNEQQFNSYMHS